MESFAAYCRRVAEAKGGLLRSAIGYLPADTDWSYASAVNSLTHHRAPAWTRQELKRVRDEHLAAAELLEPEPVHVNKLTDPEPVENCSKEHFNEPVIDLDDYRSKAEEPVEL